MIWIRNGFLTATIVLGLFMCTDKTAAQEGMRLAHANGNPYIIVDDKETPAIIGTPTGCRFNTEGGRLNLFSPGKYLVTMPGIELPDYKQLSVNIDVWHTHSLLGCGNSRIHLTERTEHPTVISKYFIYLEGEPGQPVNRIHVKCSSNAKPKEQTLFTVPYEGSFDRPIKLTIDVQGKTLVFKVDGKVIYTHTHTGKKPYHPDLFYVSTYAAAGSFDNLTIKTDGKTILRDTFDASTPETLKARWNLQGVLEPSLMSTLGPGWYFPLDFTPDNKRTFASAGIHLYTTDAIDTATAWRGPEKFDFSGFDNELRGVLKMDPKAKFLIRLRIDPPEWWLERNPDDFARTMDRKTGRIIKHKRNLASFASEKWRKDSQHAVERFIEHLDSIPEGRRVVALNVACGTALEWVYSFDAEYHDYSPAGLRGFRTWLKNKYQTDAELQKAWKQPEITFETVTIPLPEQRNTGRIGDFLDPVHDRHVIDHNRFLSDSAADCLIGYAKTVKEKSKGRLFTVAFYGYHFLTNPVLQHYSTEKVLRSEYVDSLSCPHFYGDRGVGGTTTGQLPPKSVFLNNKLWFLEDDTRTHLSWIDGGCGRCATTAQSVEELKRNFAYTFSYSGGIWYLDFHLGWLNHESFMNVIGDFKKISRLVPPADRKENTQICVVLSDLSKAFFRTETGFSDTLYYTLYHRMISRIGAPHDAVLIEDLEKAPDYRMYIFLDTFYLTPKQREIVNRKCKKNGQTVLWVHAAGFLTDEGFSTKAMSDLVGMNIESENIIAQQTLTLDRNPGSALEAIKPFGPVLFTNDSGATKLGTVQTPAGLRGCGFAEKSFRDWKSVWTAVPVLPSSVLRKYAEDAGVHIYSDKDDWVAAAEYMVAVHAGSDGRRDIKLPRKGTVYDPFVSKTVAEHTDVIHMDMKKGDTFFGLIRGMK